MRSITVYFEDGNTIRASINGTRAEIERYYVGQAFQFGDTEECPRDHMVKAVRVEFHDLTTLELLEDSKKARNAGNSDLAIELMKQAMSRPDADRALAETYGMKPRHKETYKKVFYA